MSDGESLVVAVGAVCVGAGIVCHRGWPGGAPGDPSSGGGGDYCSTAAGAGDFGPAVSLSDSPVTLEIPAGTRVVGEPPAVTAARELREEAGLVAAQMSEITRFYPAIGVSDEELILYRATSLSEVPAAPEHGELVAREVVQLADVPELHRQGLICDAKTLIAASLLGVALFRL